VSRFAVSGRAALLSLLLVAAAPVLAAEATLDQVYQAVRAGRLDQAQGMMSEVLRDHPNSAKAHYVEAEILARQGRGGEARGELNRAEELAPGLPFASQTSVRELRGLIESGGVRRELLPGSIASGSDSVDHRSGFPWGLALIGLLCGAIVFAIVRARRNAAQASYNSGAPGTTAAAAPGYGMPPVGGGIGSGIVGGLVTGAAVGAGVVAGEALARDLMEGHGSHAAPAAPPADDLGGQDFGVNDPGSWDDGGGSDGGGGSWD
jgi:hypothetical protein